MSATEDYITVLSSLKKGDLGLLRRLGREGPDESVDGFDLFAGLWWPLRQRNQRAPRRQVAWLVAKLYAANPLEHFKGAFFAQQLGMTRPFESEALQSHKKRFNQILISPIGHLEAPMQWGLSCLQDSRQQVDWVKLTDDLSVWELEKTRTNWACLYLTPNERNRQC